MRHERSNYTRKKKKIVIIMIRKFLNYGAKPQINIWKAKGYNIRIDKNRNL